MRVAPLRVLLVEDDLDVASGIGDYLALHDVEVDFAATAGEALHLVAEQRFDLLLLDLQLPDLDGVSLCRRLKDEHGLATPVLFLTASGTLDDKLHAFAAGANDYVVKPFEPAELLARIHAITAQVARQSATVTVGRYRLDAARCLLYRQQQSLALTGLATRLLHLLMQASPGTVSRETLHDALWHGRLPDSDPLRTHVHQLRRALLARFGHSPIVTLRGVGYRFEPDDAPPTA